MIPPAALPWRGGRYRTTHGRPRARSARRRRPRDRCPDRHLQACDPFGTCRLLRRTSAGGPGCGTRRADRRPGRAGDRPVLAPGPSVRRAPVAPVLAAEGSDPDGGGGAARCGERRRGGRPVHREAADARLVPRGCRGGRAHTGAATAVPAAAATGRTWRTVPLRRLLVALRNHPSGDCPARWRNPPVSGGRGGAGPPVRSAHPDTGDPVGSGRAPLQRLSRRGRSRHRGAPVRPRPRLAREAARGAARGLRNAVFLLCDKPFRWKSGGPRATVVPGASRRAGQSRTRLRRLQHRQAGFAARVGAHRAGVEPRSHRPRAARRRHRLADSVRPHSCRRARPVPQLTPGTPTWQGRSRTGTWDTVFPPGWVVSTVPETGFT